MLDGNRIDRRWHSVVVESNSMPSWQASLSSFVIRNTVKPRLAAATDAAGIRAVLNRSGLYKAPPSVRITPATVNGVPGEWAEAGGGSTQLMLFLHGGGYVACTLETHRPYTCFFAESGFRVFSADYALAPEHPFPAGLDDAVAVYRGMRTAYPEASIAIAGDSAGGGLALAAMLRLKAEGDPLPAAAALFSPLTDLTGAGDSRASNNEKCAMFFAKGLDTIPPYYVPGSDPSRFENPLVSPVYGDYRGFPPMLIHVGEDETLRDDSLRLAAKAREAGVRIDLQVWQTVSHDWQLFYKMVPEGRQSLEQAAAFLHEHSSVAKASASR